jgi:MYXO-CTERM domain-containing protein
MRMLALCAVLCASGAASATVIWRGDFETGDISQWTSVEGLTSRLTVVQSPVRQGKNALRVELHQGDVSNSGTRNELGLETAQYQEVEGNDRWYAWSTLFPSDYPSNNTWQVFTQWHHSGCCGSPPLEFDVIGEHIQMAHNGDTVLWTAPLQRGVWHDFMVHVYWSSGSGYVELWYDGQPALAKTPVQTLYPGNYNYLKQGLYRDAAVTDVAVLYHDGFVIGTSQADVDPQPAPPPPPPPDAGTPPPADAGVSGAGASGPPAPDADGGVQQTEPDPGPATAPATTLPPSPVKTSGLPGISGCSSSGKGKLALIGLLALVTWRARRRRTPRR